MLEYLLSHPIISARGFSFWLLESRRLELRGADRLIFQKYHRAGPSRNQLDTVALVHISTLMNLLPFAG